MKRINLILIVSTLFLVSCSSEIDGEYSGSSILADFKISLKEDGTWKKTSISNGNSPFGVMGNGRETTTYGTWEINNEKTILWLRNSNSNSVIEYKIEDGLFGMSFKNTTHGSFD
jgi:hypothetical protein